MQPIKTKYKYSESNFAIIRQRISSSATTTAMRFLFLSFSCFAIVLSCKKRGGENTHECIAPAIVPFQPYSYPVWHPNGQLLGFNYTPLTGIGSNGNSPCIWYSYLANPDSTGFYIMNKNGTGLKRITNYNLYDPAWSPDGNWLAFMVGSQVYKILFTAAGFDTTNIIQLTNSGGNFFPSWTANSDTIYFDSNNDSPSGTSFYSIWKMASDGSGKTRLTQSDGIGDTRQPFIGSDNRVYYVGLGNAIFSMDKDGLNPIQITSSVSNSLGGTPKYWQGKVFYEGNGIRVVSATGGTDSRLDSLCVTYDVNTSGEIVYSKMDYDITKYNKQIGTLWIMNADGSKKKQLTFNNF